MTTKKTVIIGAFFAFLVFLPVSALVYQNNQLIEKISTQSLPPEEGQTFAEENGSWFLPQAMAAGGRTSPIIDCSDGYETWTSSLYYKTGVPWSLDFASPYTSGSSKVVFFQDINGDSLSDYVYKFYYNDSYSGQSLACTYLNTGNGWISQYKCYGKRTSSVNSGAWTFYGDCADTSQ